MVKKPYPFHKPFSPLRRLLRRTLSGRHHRRSTAKGAAVPPTEKLQGQTVIVDVEAWLLMSRLSTFPYFMLVAVEAGGFLRGLLLLLTYPLMCLFGHDMRLRAMVMVSFFGLREKEVLRVSKAVLPKLFLEDVASQGLEAVKKARDKYPKPLVFHDGRLAFTPTFSAAIAMYTYIPFGIFLAILRSTAYSLLPYRVSVPIGALTGMRSRIIAGPPAKAMDENKAGGRLYVCNHRTLLDPITVAAGLRKPVTAVTYSVSPVSELMAPIRTARLTRDRDEDRRRMAGLLARGNLVVCPEGTTCREPYLLRFSPLFAELAAEVTPVALETRVDMFYGTSTKPASKVLDPLYFMMNPRPEYRVEFLDPVDTTTVADGDEDGHGHDKSHSIHVANRVQRVLGEALAFELTEQTRKDKYMMLAGNEGIVKVKANRRCACC
ncbi:unnamed protein product [Triticum turgidum subsp. durum]|uniref:Phospholipid/glycerol acyltransferase domain-containing protein n=1 Tax=Triticum turgidum subsp. durum TaxID=4567 RepID=A0A9R1NLM1_TRITD|nr:unnamed protein product [Triticum turgidum subsp. durum]